MGENLYWAFSLGALLIAALYYTLWPKPLNSAHAAARPIILRWLLRWGHSVVWVLLALFFMGKTGFWSGSMAIWQPFGIAALCLYGLFLLAIFIDRNYIAKQFRR